MTQHTQKMRTIKFKNGAVMRVSETLALPYIESGKAHYVPKSTLKSFWKNQGKLEFNNAYLEKFNFGKDQDKNFLHKESNGKVYAYLLRKVKEKVEVITPEKKEIKKLSWWQKLTNAIGISHFEPKEVVIIEGKLKLVQYPMYQRFLVGIQN